MSDLVNRLRGTYAIGPKGVYGTRSFADFIPPISLEAADRIEVLEAKLLFLVNNDSINDPSIDQEVLMLVAPDS